MADDFGYQRANYQQIIAGLHGACLLLACAVARQVDKLVIVLHG